MAKFQNYNVLCPLIDQKSFMGVSLDKEPKNVIVTLGRNVVNKYRLSDQKQVGGWTSKDHITSAVIYNNDEKRYVGVFNNNTIKMWMDDENLNKIKKYKFPVNIHMLIGRSNQTPLIIFTNGNCASLTYAIENRKTYDAKSIIKDNDTIIEAAHYFVRKQKTEYICYILKNIKYEIVTCPIRDELGDLEKSKIKKVKITRPEDVYVVGHFIDSEDLDVYVLWSDSKMTAYDLYKQTWRTVGTVPWLSTYTSVSITWMGKNHLIMFGSNTEQDGAIIVAYNIQLGVGSCRYPMKMYRENAKLYCFNKTIILEASNHIGMLPYALEIKRNLSRLLGSHEVIQNEFTELVEWDSPTEHKINVIKEIEELIKLGLTERAICSQIIPPMLEKKDFRHIYLVVKQLIDIPESILVNLLKLSVNLINPHNSDVTKDGVIAKICSVENDANCEFLNQLLQVSFSDALIIPHLRNNLALDDSIFLMSYICHMIMEGDRTIFPDFESKLYDWCTLFMDAFYQQFLLTKDDKVTYALNNMSMVVTSLMEQLMAVSDVMPTLNKLVSGNQINDNNNHALPYVIEMLQI